MTRRAATGLALLIGLSLTACAAMPVRSGTRPRIDLVATALEVGKTQRGQVLEILGPPDGAGRVRLPMHPEPRAVWNYVEQDAGWDELSWHFLALFFDDEVLSGYVWYTIENLPIDNSTPEWIRQTFEK